MKDGYSWSSKEISTINFLEGCVDQSKLSMVWSLIINIYDEKRVHCTTYSNNAKEKVLTKTSARAAWVKR